MRYYIQLIGVLSALFIFSSISFGQDTDTLPKSEVLSIEQVYELVLANHPIAKQAYFITDKAKQELRMARGNFDPKFESNFSNKIFKGDNYYELFDTYLKVPTWLGAEIKAGYERNTGINLDPENDTDDGNGLGYVGVSIPLGPISKGFLMDKRRATLRKAEIYQLEAEAERLKAINKLLLQVAKDYWQWYFHYNEYRLFQEGYELASFRYRAVVQRIAQGDLAPIDSVEAKITIQQRLLNLQESEIRLNNARLILSNHIWSVDEEPVEIKASIIPQEFSSEVQGTAIERLLQYAEEQHPELRKLNYKLAKLAIERKWAMEQLKPEIRAKYNLLTTRPIGENELDWGLLSNYYKFGFDVSIPLLFRKGRGKFKMTQIKQNETNQALLYQRQSIANQIQAYYREFENLTTMLTTQEDMVRNYRRLLSGERQKFRNGLSSVFYVNVREGKLIEAEVKLYKMRHKYAKTYALLLWAAGSNEIDLF
ncbi:MAG: TolC family protein [Flammeovirgaceae bacterium]